MSQTFGKFGASAAGWETPKDRGTARGSRTVVNTQGPSVSGQDSPIPDRQGSLTNFFHEGLFSISISISTGEEPQFSEVLGFLKVEIEIEIEIENPLWWIRL